MDKPAKPFKVAYFYLVKYKVVPLHVPTIRAHTHITTPHAATVATRIPIVAIRITTARIAIAALTIPAAVPIPILVPIPVPVPTPVPTAYAIRRCPIVIVVIVDTTAAKAIATSVDVVIVVVIFVVVASWSPSPSSLACCCTVVPFGGGSGRGIVWSPRGVVDVSGGIGTVIGCGCSYQFATYTVQSFKSNMNDLDETWRRLNLWRGKLNRQPRLGHAILFCHDSPPLKSAAALRSLTAASALSLWPSPPPLAARRSTLTPTSSQRARAAMLRHARPTTTLARRVRVPARDTADGTPRRIKGTCGYSARHTHHHLPGGPCAHDDDDAAVDDDGDDDKATLHDGDDGEATSLRR
ncbi:hypothetical protein EDB83DRAFT_2317587 [Lactarius deliciosus]|nr:hypothetical protein EDB83DRAFT_2317587 [Lactarius deliciosus]